MGVGVWIMLSIGVAFSVVGVLMRILELRSRPRCPVHNIRMELVGDTESTEEFACYIEDCSYCADVHLDGRVDFFTT